MVELKLAVACSCGVALCFFLDLPKKFIARPRRGTLHCDLAIPWLRFHDIYFMVIEDSRVLTMASLGAGKCFEEKWYCGNSKSFLLSQLPGLPPIDE
jgi:hypothetical protein